MKLRRIVVCLVSLVFLVVLSGTVSAATPISGCTIITSPGSYYLTQDIINSTNSTCISITSSDVIFDGAGYTIDGVDSWSTIGLYAYKSTTALTNVTVKNLTMSDWYRGTYYNNVSIGSIDYYTANSNDYYGIAFLYASNININNSIFLNNGNGIRVDDFSNNNKLNNLSFITLGCGEGIAIEHSDYNTLTNINSSNGCMGMYINDGSFNTLTNITVFSNSWEGIYVDGTLDNNTFTNINSYSNNYGIYLGSSGNTLTNSNISSNIVAGIAVEGSNNHIYNNLFNNTNNYNFWSTETNDWNTTILGTNIIGGPFTGGNFWANPNGTGFSETCTDNNYDGFCDSTYNLASGNVDYLPLTTPFHQNVNAELERFEAGMQTLFPGFYLPGVTVIDRLHNLIDAILSLSDTCKQAIDDFLGNPRPPAQTLIIRPNGAGTYNAWSGTYQDVDETTQNGDTDYIFTNQKNKQHSFNLEDRSTETGTITKVSLIVWGKYQSGSEGTYIGIITNGVTHTSDKLTFSNSYTEYTMEWTTNPQTGSPWTWTEVDALEAYVKSASIGKWNPNEQRITQVYVEVYY